MCVCVCVCFVTPKVLAITRRFLVRHNIYFYNFLKKDSTANKAADVSNFCKAKLVTIWAVRMLWQYILDYITHRVIYRDLICTKLFFVEYTEVTW